MGKRCGRDTNQFVNNAITMARTTDRLLLLSIFLLSLLHCGHSNTIERTGEIIEGMKCGDGRSELSCIANMSVPGVAEKMRSGLYLSQRRYPYTGATYDTIDLVFSGGDINIQSGFFDSIHTAYLTGTSESESSHNTNDASSIRENQEFQKAGSDVPLEFRVKFQNFDSLQLGPKAFSNVFPKEYFNHADGKPSRTLNMVVNVYNSKAAEINISSGVFDGLVVSTLTIHNADLSRTSYERLFGKTSIHVLDLKGSYIHTDPNVPFEGKIDKVNLIKQAATLDSNEFPRYPVDSYTLTAQNIRWIDGQSLVSHDNVHQLEIKSNNCTLERGDLRALRNLRHLSIEGVNVEGGAFDGLDSLESMHIGEGVSVSSEDVKALLELPNLGHLDYDPRLGTMNEKEKCYLITRLLQNPKLRRTTQWQLSSSREPCSCEHTMFARLNGNQQNPCFETNRDCRSDSCPAVRDFFIAGDEIATVPQGEQITAQILHQRGNLGDNSFSSEAYEVGPTLETRTDDIERDNIDDDDVDDEDRIRVYTHKAVAEEDTYSAEQSKGSQNLMTPAAVALPDVPAKKATFNWLPIIIIISVIVALVLIGVLVYLVRKRRERNREFKPIPTSESGAAKR
ncbi:hypothetical protein ACOME3_010274 [Neoechinorhynchus agilis]